jgi:hypothetical protein
VLWFRFWGIVTPVWHRKPEAVQIGFVIESRQHFALPLFGDEGGDMPRFLVQGWRRVVVFEQSSTEIEALDQQSAIEQVKEQCAEGQLGWSEQDREEQDFRWSANLFIPQEAT